MVHIYEFRIRMPFTVEEYQKGQLHAIAMMSQEESDKGEGVEILKNEEFQNKDMGKGQFTHKIYHVGKSLPGWIQKLLPNLGKMLDFHEEAYNCYPECKTIISSKFMKDKFALSIMSKHRNGAFDADKDIQNIHGLKDRLLKKRKVVYIDIAGDKPKKYKKNEDPKLIQIKDGPRGPLTDKKWWNTEKKCMTCYKLVTIKAKMPIVQSKIEKKVLDIQKDIFLSLHRKMYSTTDTWVGMSLEDIRKIEDKVAEEMAELYKDAKEENPLTEEQKKMVAEKKK